MTKTMNATRMRTATVLLAGLVMVGAPVLAGCGQIAEQAAEKAAEQAIGGDVDVNDQGVTVTDDEGNQVAVGEDVALPDNWPAEVPVFDGGTLSMVTVQADGSANAIWMTDAPPEEAAASYTAALEAAGYTSDSNSSMGAMFISEYTGNGYKVSTNTLAADGQTTVMVNATKDTTQ
jgi:hypothetical protein